MMMMIIIIIQNGPRKVARPPFCTCPFYCTNFGIYAMLRNQDTFSWPTL